MLVIVATMSVQTQSGYKGQGLLSSMAVSRTSEDSSVWHGSGSISPRIRY